ncbi:hypothetical protein TSUD_147340 [Trifolium subterraneum]|uniref:Uncharacterized protein n=1 Tax=Trifolium subterraneum TaxID=3900 RepID=A0A2Z6NWL6_TRISU|nr:hypothetical protein TSUD_147340 [Trifolium subterraneum]
MRPLPPGDPPRPCEQEALIEQEAETECPVATNLSRLTFQKRRASIWDVSHYAQHYRKMDGGGAMR